MATTRELIVHVLEHDKPLRDWFESEHGFTLDKALSCNLAKYQDLVGVILADGFHDGVLTKPHMEGTEELKICV
jgi:hypothetical protein